MKKILVAILAFVYLLVSSGIAMNTHYCMGKVASVELYQQLSDKCGKCGMHNNDNNGCCKDEYKMLKLQDSHKLTDINIPINFTAILLPIAYLDIQPKAIHCNSQTLAVNYSPPEDNSPSLSILNCVFRC